MPDKNRGLNVLKGRCGDCGLPREVSRFYCNRCLLRKRLRGRKASHSQPWKKGGRGRPPLV